MEITPVKMTVEALVQGYVDHAEQGVRAYSGNLDVRPAYQREFVYKDAQRNAVIDTIRKGYPLNIMYWADREDGTFEVLDGQQRTISVAQYVKGQFSIDDMYFSNLQDDQQQQILDYELTIYRCKGSDSEKLEWFKTINIAGEELSDQELRNAVYHGPWVADAKKWFSKPGCPAYAIGKDLVAGELNRQKYLETAIKWINGGEIEAYMAAHQHDPNALELWTNFQTVITWVTATFPTKHAKMRGLPWGPLYGKYGSNKYDAKIMDTEAKRLHGDSQVTSKAGIYEFLLGRATSPQLLSVRVFDENTKAARYAQQTTDAEKAGISNCPLCAGSNNSNNSRLYEQREMDADHVTAWSKGGATDLGNCEMLCVTHNRSKGNR